MTLNIPLITEGETNSTPPARFRTFLRNPERNLGWFFRIESAMVQGDEIQFADSDGEVLATGRSVDSGERFTLLFPRFGETFDFTRRDRKNAPSFYPRRSPEPLVSLLQPVEAGDGWTTATPRETGLDPALLEDMINEIAAFEPTELRQPYIHSILCLLYTSPSPRDQRGSRMPSSA